MKKKRKKHHEHNTNKRHRIPIYMMDLREIQLTFFYNTTYDSILNTHTDTLTHTSYYNRPSHLKHFRLLLYHWNHNPPEILFARNALRRANELYLHNDLMPSSCVWGENNRWMHKKIKTIPIFFSWFVFRFFYFEFFFSFFLVDNKSSFLVSRTPWAKWTIFDMDKRIKIYSFVLNTKPWQILVLLSLLAMPQEHVIQFTWHWRYKIANSDLC